jgi:hypothetical protein
MCVHEVGTEGIVVWWGCVVCGDVVGEGIGMCWREEVLLCGRVGGGAMVVCM